MSRGRPSKKGLDWFKKDIGYYEDFKIMDLINEYGPLGNTVFDCILCMIYREGYYLEIPLEKLCLAIVRAIGSKWVKKHQVLQVIQYCADIGLLHKDLLARSVVTSAGIQRRYAEATSRNKVNKSLYWLIDENGQPLKTISSDGISVTEIHFSATENPISDAESPQEKNKSKNKNKRESIAAGAATPTLDEVREYAKGKRANPDRFWRHYESVGWKRAGTPIVNWKVVFDEWDAEDIAKSPEPPHKPSYDLEEIERYYEIHGSDPWTDP